MPSQLYLIGINHHDLKGPQRLEKVLEYCKPEIISLELDQQRVAKIEEAEKKYFLSAQGRRELNSVFYNSQYNSQTVNNLISVICFEYFITRNYSKKEKIPLILSDKLNPETHTAAIEALRYSLSRTPQELQQRIEEAYLRQKVEVDQNLVGAWTERDAIAEATLRQLPGKVAHIGGGGHIFGNYHNLYLRLLDLKPTRLMLNQADYL